MEQKELMTLYAGLRLTAIDQLIFEFAHKNRAKTVQKLLELKRIEEQKLGLNKPLQAQYGQQNSGPKGLSFGINKSGGFD